MKLATHCNPNFAFIAVATFALSLQVRANHTDSSFGNYPDLQTQNISEKQSTMEDTSNLIPQTTDQNDNLKTTQMQTDTFPSSILCQESSTSSCDINLNLTSTVQDALTTTNTVTATWTQITTSDICGEKNKSLILICFIIIAVLVLACTFLLLSTVVMANKVSYLKRSKQGKRMPRSNGDFLAASSLWPAGSDTWQRKSKELTGVDLMIQDLMSETAITVQRNHATGTTEKLTSREATNQKNEEATSKPCDSTITNFVVEI